MFKCVLSLLVLLTFTIYMVNADVFSLLETNSDLSVDSRILLSTHALKPGHPVITKCVTHRMYPLQLRFHQSFVGSSELQFALYKAFGQVSMLGGESHEQSSPCHYRLKVQFNNVTSYNQADMVDKPASLQTLMPHWDLVHTVTAKMPITFDQSIDGSITNIQIPSVANMDVSAEMAEGYEDAIHALLFQLEFKSNSIGKPHSARSGVAHAYRGHEYAPGDDYRVTTVYSGEERVYEAAQPSQTPETITIFRVVRDFVPDQRKPASESVIYVNHRVITENFVRPGVAGVAHSQQRQIVTNIQDTTVRSKFDQQDPDLQASGGANFKFAIESVAILGDALDYLPELQRLIKAEQIFPVYGPETRRDRNSVAPAADATAQNFKNDSVSENNNMRFRSLRSRSSASRSIQAAGAPATKKKAATKNKAAAVKVVTDFGTNFGSGEYAVQDSIEFGGNRDLLGYFAPGIKVVTASNKITIGAIVDLGGIFWGQYFSVVKAVPAVVMNLETKTRQFELRVLKPEKYDSDVKAAFGFTKDAEKKLFPDDSKKSPTICKNGLNNAWLKRPVASYVFKQTFQTKSKPVSVGGKGYEASVWGVRAKVHLTFELQPSITIGSDLCRKKPTVLDQKNWFASAGFQINLAVRITVLVTNLATKEKPPVALLSGSVGLIDLKWQVAYSTPLSSPLKGCISFAPSAAVLGGEIKGPPPQKKSKNKDENLKASAAFKDAQQVIKQMDWNMWKSKPISCAEGFQGLKRVWCIDNVVKSVTAEKPKSVADLLFPGYTEKWDIFLTCTGNELVSRQQGATPIWLRPDPKNKKEQTWQWTPFSPDTSPPKDRIWIPCNTLTVPKTAKKWADKKPAPANQNLINNLCENPTGKADVDIKRVASGEPGELYDNQGERYGNLEDPLV